MIIEATFVTSAATANGLPRDGLAEIAMVGRSNVGKSSLINALVRQRVARTSAAPGKTRLANVYRVARGGAAPFYLVWKSLLFLGALVARGAGGWVRTPRNSERNDEQAREDENGAGADHADTLGAQR